jgi:uncharacterized hydrophobic protein (TIGR00271 family)
MTAREKGADMPGTATVTADDVGRMTEALFIERSWRSPSASKFWVLLVLASIIATAGVVADSTATVIGAMIVAPLMTPILGIALAVVIGDRHALLRSLLYVVGGAALVVAIGFAIGLVAAHPDAYAANTQVAGRISPRLIDLLAALATGTVGAFALVRRDISDTLPGVAIAISLVPPLAVVGLLLEVGRYSDAAQALLLFGTNVAAIVLTGTVLLGLFRVRQAAVDSGHVAPELGPRTFVVIIGLVLLVAVPLAIGTANVVGDSRLSTTAKPVAQEWAARAGWQVTTVEAINGTVVVTALGPPPEVAVDALRTALNDAGLADHDLSVRLIVGGTRFCARGGTTCVARSNVTP